MYIFFITLVEPGVPTKIKKNNEKEAQEASNGL